MAYAKNYFRTSGYKRSQGSFGRFFMDYSFVRNFCAYLSWIVFPFIYNKLYIKELIKKGFKVKKVIDSDIKILEAKLGFPLPQ